MEKDPSIEQTARRLVEWAARNPLGAREVEQRYAHLLVGLESGSGVPAVSGVRKSGEEVAAESAIFQLGRLVVRYWKDVQQSIDDLSLGDAIAVRGGGPADAVAPERVLRAQGQSGAACVKVTENPDHATVALALWLDPKTREAAAPFSVTVVGDDGAVVAGPVPCEPRQVVRFATVASAGPCSIVFRTEAETWTLRWHITPA